MKYTKIVATINGSSCTEELIARLQTAGMDVVRLNTAHMSIEEMERTVAIVRRVSDKLAIMVDTKGPNIRVGSLPEPLRLRTGDRIEVSGGPLEAPGMQVNYSRFANEVSPGSRIVIDDGDMELLVVERRDGRLVCEALRDGEIKAHKSVNVPGAEMKMPALTPKDREFIDCAIRHNIDFIAHSFVRNAGDILAVKSILETADSSIKIIAKIENRQGVDNLESIIEAADGIMVARGDLGIEIPLEEVPTIQKNMIHLCMKRGKPVITATQMLQSMETNPRPTRAEVSDVANAVFDGTDAVMLSGETAQGKYPVEAVAMMCRILEEAERSPRQFFTKISEILTDIDPGATYMIQAAVNAVDKLPVKAIICNTGGGKSARLCASYRAKVPVYAFSYNPQSVRQLALSYGVRPELIAYHENLLELSRMSIKALYEAGKIHENELIVFISRQSHAVAYNNLCCISSVKEMLQNA